MPDRRLYIIGNNGPHFYDADKPYPTSILDDYGITSQDGLVTDGAVAILEKGDVNGFTRAKFESTRLPANTTQALPPRLIGSSSTELLVEEGFSETMAKVFLHWGRANSGNDATAVTANPWGGFGDTQGTSSSVNFFYDVGDSEFKMENTRGNEAALFFFSRLLELGN